MFTPQESAKLHEQLATLPDDSPGWCAICAVVHTAEANARLAVYAPQLTPEDRAWRAGYGQALVDLANILEAIRQWTPPGDEETDNTET